MDASSDDPYSIARSLMKHREIDDVEASSTQIRVAHVADDPHARAIPERLVAFLTDTFSDTKFVWANGEPSPTSVEVYSGGHGQNALTSPIGTDETELQVRFVEEKR